MATKSPGRAGSGRRPRAGRKLITAPRVFWPAAVLVVSFVTVTVIWPDRAERLMDLVRENVIGAFGWYYVLIVALFVAFSLWMGLSRFGDIRLGKDDDLPEFGLRSLVLDAFRRGYGHRSGVLGSR